MIVATTDVSDAALSGQRYHARDRCPQDRAADHGTVRLLRSAPAARGAGEPVAVVPAEGNVSAVYHVVKRLFDVVGSAVLLVLFAPVMIGTLLILLATTRGRPLFVQERIGHRGRRFPMIKFRTMGLGAEALQGQLVNEQEGPVFKNRRDPRITRIGAVLRKTSIDEMPQLLNVLAGHMSLVGPRPPVEKEVAEYRLWQRRRLAVKPGLTCLWQVSGRSEIGFEEWVRMDIWYIQNQKFWTDVGLLARTPMSVLSGIGAY